MAHCIWQLDGPQVPKYVIGHFLAVSVGEFLDEASMGISGLSKADCPPQRERASPNQLKA